MQRITFQEVAIHSEKSLPCAGGCKRRLKRRQKFWQTLSPFNRNAARATQVQRRDLCRTSRRSGRVDAEVGNVHTL